MYLVALLLIGVFLSFAIGGFSLGSVIWYKIERQFLTLKMESMEKKIAEFGSTN